MQVSSELTPVTPAVSRQTNRIRFAEIQGCTLHSMLVLQFKGSFKKSPLCILCAEPNQPSEFP